MDRKLTSGHGYTIIEVLDFLIGRKYDIVAQAFITALRPSCVEVITGRATCNALPWRVRVVIDSDNVIRKIYQEVNINLPEGVAHGHALQMALKFGIDSPEVANWGN